MKNQNYIVYNKTTDEIKSYHKAEALAEKACSKANGQNSREYTFKRIK